MQKIYKKIHKKIFFLLYLSLYNFLLQTMNIENPTNIAPNNSKTKKLVRFSEDLITTIDYTTYDFTPKEKKELWQTKKEHCAAKFAKQSEIIKSIKLQQTHRYSFQPKKKSQNSEEYCLIILGIGAVAALSCLAFHEYITIYNQKNDGTL